MLLALCRGFREKYNIGTLNITLENFVALSLTYVTYLLLTADRNFNTHVLAAVTNDIFTREDQEFLIRNEALPAERIRAIETGGCPHAAIREDISANMGALEKLQAEFDTEMLFVESGGDNLAGKLDIQAIN